jgi:magnesium chelatase family protein
MDMNTENYKTKLEEEYAKLEAELETVGVQNPKNPSDWEAKETEIDVTNNENDELADKMEEYGEHALRPRVRRADFTSRPHIVSVETDLSRGLHAFTLVGLPDKAVEESRDRVAAAIKHSGFDSPKSRNQKIVISLAPADLKKEGPMFDLPIALSYLLASEDIRFDPEPYLFIGELSLDGKLRPVRGVLPLIAQAKKDGKKAVFVPKENVEEAALVPGIEIYGVESLKEVIEHLNTKSERKKRRIKLVRPASKQKLRQILATRICFEDIRGQESAKRAAIIAAAGGHNLGL